jgi:hypothetical protein
MERAGLAQRGLITAIAAVFEIHQNFLRSVLERTPVRSYAAVV